MKQASRLAGELTTLPSGATMATVDLVWAEQAEQATVDCVAIVLLDKQLRKV
ncbi:MAG: hypothetical protein WAK26_04000 [Terracidiphilus sp.]